MGLPNTPHRGRGPIFIRKGARAAEPAVDEIPEMLTRRLISVRAYNEGGMMVDTEVVDGSEELRNAITRMLGRMAGTEEAAYLHLHNAGAGCFNCRVERAQAPE